MGREDMSMLEGSNSDAAAAKPIKKTVEVVVILFGAVVTLMGSILVVVLYGMNLTTVSILLWCGLISALLFMFAFSMLKS